MAELGRRDALKQHFLQWSTGSIPVIAIMSNCRYIFQKTISTRCPQFFREGKTVVLTIYPPDKFEDFYQTAQIDLYSAPDVIMPYSNGNTCKDEWRRLDRYIFTNLKLISLNLPLLDELIVANFSYDDFKRIYFQYGDPEQEVDIPMGKFYGMTYEQVQKYKRKNISQWEKPKPSKEAIDAVLNYKPSLSLSEVEEMLTIAYKVDL